MKKELDIKTIRAAVCASRGGLDGAADTALRRLWDKLDADTQRRYLDAVKPTKTERKPDAHRDGPE